MTERKKKFEELRERYRLDSGSVDDVVEKLNGERDILSQDFGYLSINCPFAEDFDCKYGLVEEDWNDLGDEEFLYVGIAAHMLTSHLELEDE